MDHSELDELAAVVAPLLRALDALGLVARHLTPFDIDGLVGAVAEHETVLRAARARIESWPSSLERARPHLVAATDAALAVFGGLSAARTSSNGALALFRALRHLTPANEALYPLTRALVPVSQFFLTPEFRNDEDLLRRLWEAEPSAEAGLFHAGGEAGARGGFSAYVPEYYTTDRPWPLVVALHGGSGNGRGFLWSWLRDARSHGAILLAPSSMGDTWAIQGEDPDSPKLAQLVALARQRWNIDPRRLLLTGMSDGGTFSYVSGLETSSPFTHLAPISAAFHPMLAEFADRTRLEHLPIHIVHGARDWMFPADMARQAEQLFAAAGARVTCREIADLSHTYPREANAGILRWLDETAG